MIRELSAQEFDRLVAVDDGFKPDPACSIALVEERDREIVGRVFLLSPVHLEGPWVKPELRGSLLGYRLMKAAAEKAKSCGLSKLFAYAANPQLADYLRRLGYRPVPLTVWEKEL